MTISSIKKALLLLSITAATAIANPILSHKYTADPQPFVWKDRLYVYASFDNNNPIKYDGSYPGYDIQYYTLMSTNDMVNWTDHGEVFSVKRDVVGGWASNCYAPGVAVRNGKIYLYVPNSGANIGVVTADRPEGPFDDVNRAALITKNAAINTQVEWLFDPMAFIDDDDQAYLYFGGGPVMCGPENAEYPCNPGPGQNLRVIKLNDDMISLDGRAETIDGAERSFEAAYMHKRDGKYYFSFSQNFSGNADIAYMMSDSPIPTTEKPFEFQGVMIPNNQNTASWGNHHQAAIEYEDNWYAFYHDRRAKSANNPCDNCERRSVSVDKLEYNPNGTIIPVTGTTTGVEQIKKFNPYDTIPATTMNKQSGSVSPYTPMIKTSICSAPMPGTVSNNAPGSAGAAGDTCVMLTSIANDSWIRLKGVDFGENGAAKVTVRATVVSPMGGSIEFRSGSNDGELLGSCQLRASIAPVQGWQNITCPLDKEKFKGEHDYLYLVFKSPQSESLMLSQYVFEEDKADDGDDGDDDDTSIRNKLASQNKLSPQVTVRGKILNVSSPDNSKLKIRLIDTKGKVRANFKSSGNANISLNKIPAGRYFVEMRGTGVKQTIPVMIK